ncbi:MAG TPA: ABC transporter ATP-binding protein [Gemmatimonadales bacterium]
MGDGVVGVRFAGVRKVYAPHGDELEAISRVDLEIPAGSFVSVVGPSGCGKSTLMLMLAGLIERTEGEIHIGSELVTGPRADVGMVFQSDTLLEWRTALDNILLQAEMRRLKRKDYTDRAHQLLDLVGLAGFEHKYPRELSGGMRQRVSVARALLMELPVLLLDEPFGALDALTRDQLVVDFQHMWARARPTVLFVTHSIDEAVFQSDYVVVMSPRPGRIARVIEIKLARPRRLALRSSDAYGCYVKEVREMFLDFGVLREHDEGVEDGALDRDGSLA